MNKWIVAAALILFGFLFILPTLGEEGSFNPAELYDAAIELYYQGRFEEAIQHFSKMILSFPRSKLVSYSQYMIGLCFLRMDRYEEALQQFKLYLRNHPDGDRVKEAGAGIRTSEERLKEGKGSIGTAAKGKPPEGKKSKRRICAQVFYLEGKTLEEVEKVMKKMTHAGVDTLILKVFQNKGDRRHQFVTSRREEGVYFKTELAPVVEDILGRVTDIAHRNGVDLFAWMTTRYANFGLDGLPDYRCKRFNFQTKQLEVARGFNLFHPYVQTRLEGLFRDLGRYPIDGILFQDDLILKHNEDFSAEANKAFLKEYGFLPHPDLFYIDPCLSSSGKVLVKAYADRFWTWSKWKNRSLMSLAQKLMSAARESNPRLKFGINLYYEAILNPSNGLSWFSQTLTDALKVGFDYYAVMAYHRQAMIELNIEEERAVQMMAEVAKKAVKSIVDPSSVMMKVQILDWKKYEVLPSKEVEKALDRILGHGEVSLAFVPYVEQFPLHRLKGKWIKSFDKSVTSNQ